MRAVWKRHPLMLIVSMCLELWAKIQIKIIMWNRDILRQLNLEIMKYLIGILDRNSITRKTSAVGIDRGIDRSAV